MRLYTVECCYNMVQYDKKLYTLLHWLIENVNHSVNPPKTPHISPYRASYGESFVRVLEKIDQIIMAPNCIWFIMIDSVIVAKWCHMVPGEHCKNTYELLNLRALKFSPVNKIYIFQCMGNIFCVEFQRYPLKFHTKYLTHTLKDMNFIQHWNFKSS